MLNICIISICQHLILNICTCYYLETNSLELFQIWESGKGLGLLKNSGVFTVHSNFLPGKTFGIPSHRRQSEIYKDTKGYKLPDVIFFTSSACVKSSALG